MDNERSSKFIPYSLGIVVVDKARGSDQIKVYPVEELPQIEGKITDFKKDLKVTSTDIKGATSSSSVKGDAIIVAEWISPGNGNRNTSPDVIKNETVQIYRFADTDQYYWDTLFREPKLRRLETVCHMYGNLPKGMEPFTKESSYWMEVSTHDQHIQVHTTKSNKEPFEYDIKLNTATGELLIKDDIGNQIYLSSRAHQIKMINTNGAFYDMLGDNITINAPATIKHICQDFIVEAGNTIKTHAGSSTTMNSGSSTDITAPQNTVHGKLTVTGNTNLQQGLNVSGQNNNGKTGTFQGSFEISQNLTVNQNINAGGNITASGTVHGSNI